MEKSSLRNYFHLDKDICYSTTHDLFEWMALFSVSWMYIVSSKNVCYMKGRNGSVKESSEWKIIYVIAKIRIDTRGGDLENISCFLTCLCN